MERSAIRAAYEAVSGAHPYENFVAFAPFVVKIPLPFD
jgi:hypothetical protein